MIKTHADLLREFVAKPFFYPEGRFKGDGIVICGGGKKYFTCAWVCINVLRRLGCYLPIQLWHLGGGEMTGSMSELVKPLEVECVDGLEIRKVCPSRILNGWELKPYSIIQCPFERVILLDADCVPVIDPTFLFETTEFVETGAIFWPDFGVLEPDRKIWEACGLKYVDEPEFESGQIVINKKKCWKELSIAMHLNEYSDYYYNLIHGDKETFHMAFSITGKPYSMPSRGIHTLESTMCQHDFSGRRIFQHRNLDKWNLWVRNKVVAGFEHEAVCFELLDELRRKWHDAIDTSLYYGPETCQSEVKEAARMLIDTKYQYVRVGHDQRAMTFGADGTVQRGRQEREVFWNIHHIDGQIVLQISSCDAVTCKLWPENGNWIGKWEVCEKMPVELRATK